MKKSLSLLLMSFTIAFGSNSVNHCQEDTVGGQKLERFTFNFDDIATFFPKTIQEIEVKTQVLIEQARKGVAAIVAIPDSDRSYDNTVRAHDIVASNYLMQVRSMSTLVYVSPDDALRDAVRTAQAEITEAFTEIFGFNVALYNALRAYNVGNACVEKLSPEERYFLDNELESYKRNGLDLPEEARKHLGDLTNELSKLALTFRKNIDEDSRSITATQEELEGVEEVVIAGLKQTEDGLYVVTLDTPTYNAVQSHCNVTDTRKRLYTVLNNRAYPVNMPVLDEILLKRDEQARILGYESFAHLTLEDQMAKTPEIAQAFIDSLIIKVQDKADQEFNAMVSELPPSVTLSREGKIYSWDIAFARSWYKKNQYQLDERKVSEYFPMQQTIDRLLCVYEKFFDIVMIKEPIHCLWISDLTLVKVYTKHDAQLIGYLILDVHQRPNKYSHACHINVLPGRTASDGLRVPALSLVIANFAHSTESKDSLLARGEVCTFFHEFGHALHAVFGATSLASQSGTRVKRDFLEMPSQMLEEWLFDKDILKYLSGHYVTGEPLSDSLIQVIIESKNFATGLATLEQCYLALLSLGLHGPGGCKDNDTFARDMKTRVHKNIEYPLDEHFQVRFGHLTGYGAKYYGYLWSQVYALDLFNYIKTFGLLNAEIGTVYAQKVLSKGGSKDPMKLMVDFLGREPNQEAFLKDLGLT